MNSKAKPLAIIALILGILSGLLGLLFALAGYAAAITALVLGIIALAGFKRGFWTDSEKRTITVCGTVGIIAAVFGLATSFASGLVGALLDLGVIELSF